MGSTHDHEVQKDMQAPEIHCGAIIFFLPSGVLGHSVTELVQLLQSHDFATKSEV